MNSNLENLSKEALIERLSFLEERLEENIAGRTMPNTWGAESSMMMEEYKSYFGIDEKRKYNVSITFGVYFETAEEMDCDLLYDHIAAQMKNEIPQDLDQEIKDNISHWDVDCIHYEIEEME
jgi:hypothetical protein